MPNSDANLPPLGELCAAYTHPRKDNEETAEFRRCLQWALVDMAKKSYDKEGDATKFWKSLGAKNYELRLEVIQHALRHMKRRPLVTDPPIKKGDNILKLQTEVMVSLKKGLRRLTKPQAWQVVGPPTMAKPRKSPLTMARDLRTKIKTTQVLEGVAEGDDVNAVIADVDKDVAVEKARLDAAGIQGLVSSKLSGLLSKKKRLEALLSDLQKIEELDEEVEKGDEGIRAELAELHANVKGMMLGEEIPADANVVALYEESRAARDAMQTNEAKRSSSEMTRLKERTKNLLQITRWNNAIKKLRSRLGDDDLDDDNDDDDDEAGPAVRSGAAPAPAAVPSAAGGSAAGAAAPRHSGKAKAPVGRASPRQAPQPKRPNGGTISRTTKKARQA